MTAPSGAVLFLAGILGFALLRLGGDIDEVTDCLSDSFSTLPSLGEAQVVVSSMLVETIVVVAESAPYFLFRGLLVDDATLDTSSMSCDRPVAALSSPSDRASSLISTTPS